MDPLDRLLPLCNPVRGFAAFVNGENMARNRDSAPEEIPAELLADFDDDPHGLIWDEDEPIESSTKKKRAKKSTKAAGASSSKKPGPEIAPFMIHRFDENAGRYTYLVTWKGKKHPPGPDEIRDGYGPGRYQVKDKNGASKTWVIGAPPMPRDLEPPELGAAEPPPPPRISPDLPPQAAPAYQHPPDFPQSSPQPPPWQDYRQQQQPIRPAAAPLAADPQMMGTIYRLDAAIQQISADQRRLQDELRSVTYELQQVPTRVSERVSSAIENASDPFDQVGKVMAISRDFADGQVPGDDKTPGMAEMIAGVVAALAGGGMPGAGPPPQPQAPAELAPPPRPPVSSPAPVPQNGNDQAGAAPELPGMTPEIRAELTHHAHQRGITYEAAVDLARRQNWSATDVLHVARSTAPGPPPEGQAVP